MRAMKLAVSSQSYAKAITSGKIGLFELFELVEKELKLDAVEIEHRTLKSRDPDYLRAVKSKADVCHLKIVNLGLLNDFGMARKEEREREFEKVKQWLSAPGILGSPYMRIFFGYPRIKDRRLWSEMVSYLRDSCTVAKKVGVTVLIEPEWFGLPYIGEVTLRIFEEVCQENLRLLLDLGNYVDGFHSIEKTLHLAVHVHAKFRGVDKEGNEPTIDYDTIFGLLKKRGYQKYVSVEYEADKAAVGGQKEEDEFTAVPRAIARIKRYLAEQ